MLDLIERVEAGTAEQQDLLLTEAGVRLLEGSDWQRFAAMLDAEAYESAAMMLVPEGWGKAAGDYFMEGDDGPPAWGEVYEIAKFRAGLDGRHLEGRAATPALALASAALKARSQSHG